MKVRRKNGQVCYEVVEESSSYYILQNPYTTNKCVFVAAKKDYEPVQEWVNVTKACNLHNEYGYLWFGYNNQVCGHYKNPNTRLTINEQGEIRVEVKQ